MSYQRYFQCLSLLKHKSFFLFGPRSVGKTTLISQQLPSIKVIDLLDPEEMARFASQPKRLLELDSGSEQVLIIDEIQKMPPLLDVVQMAIQKKNWRFILTGSSARKLKRQGINLLGGRAWEAHLHPLSWSELGHSFNLMKYLRQGGLPHIYDAEKYNEELKAYVALYLKEEIIQEAITRDVPAFSRFLNTFAHCSGAEMVVEQLASDAAVKASTVRNYIDILADTLLCFESHPYQKTKKRKALSRSKYWLFDVAVTNHLSGRMFDDENSVAFGKAFEHFIVREVATYLSYKRIDVPLSYWRTHDKKEVDLIVPDAFACEIKASANINDKNLSGLRAFAEENQTPKHIVVSRETEPRKINNIEILPWQIFLEKLWSGELIK